VLPDSSFPSPASLREATSPRVAGRGGWRRPEPTSASLTGRGGWLLTLAFLLAACSGRGRADNPEGTVNLFIAAARAGDRVAVYQLLGQETRARIVELLASSHQGGRNIVRPEDFFSVGWAPPAWEPAGVRTVHRDHDHAEVEVYSAAGDRHSLTLVREGKEWRIELPWG
jgi:hypothetical protein